MSLPSQTSGVDGMDVLARDTCPTCGAVVIVHDGDEGTSHMVAASSTDLARAQMERDEARQQLEGAVEALRQALAILEDEPDAADAASRASYLLADWLAANGGR